MRETENICKTSSHLPPLPLTAITVITCQVQFTGKSNLATNNGASPLAEEVMAGNICNICPHRPTLFFCVPQSALFSPPGKSWREVSLPVVMQRGCQRTGEPRRESSKMGMFLSPLCANMRKLQLFRYPPVCQGRQEMQKGNQIGIYSP